MADEPYQKELTMPVYPTGFGSHAVVPCSHCNARDEGPDPGICHRNRFGTNAVTDQPCSQCIDAAHGSTGFLGALVRSAAIAALGEGDRVPCRYCDGTGYKKL